MKGRTSGRTLGGAGFLAGSFDTVNPWGAAFQPPQGGNRYARTSGTPLELATEVRHLETRERLYSGDPEDMEEPGLQPDASERSEMSFNTTDLLWLAAFAAAVLIAVKA